MVTGLSYRSQFVTQQMVCHMVVGLSHCCRFAMALQHMYYVNFKSLLFADNIKAMYTENLCD